LKNIGGKGAAVDVKLDAKIAGVGDPGDLIPGVEYDDLGYESDEYGTLCHGSSAPCLPAASSALDDFKAFAGKRFLAPPGMTGWEGCVKNPKNSCKRTIAHL
jgi:hypothetical protein